VRVRLNGKVRAMMEVLFENGERWAVLIYG
jgi:hypothetical protein